MKKYPLRLFTALPLLLGIFFIEKENEPVQDDDGWVGTIYYTYKMFNQGNKDEMGVHSEWVYYRKAQIVISVKGVNMKEKKTPLENKQKNIAIAYMMDKLDKRHLQSSPYIKEVKNIQIITEKEKGKGEDSVNVWVEIDRQRATYTIKTNGPRYEVERKSRIWSNIIEMAGGTQPEDTSFRKNDGIAIDIPEQTMLTRDPKQLSGMHIISNSGYVHVTVTWSLRKKCPPWNNPLTQASINSLKPNAKAAAAKFIQRVNDELCIRLKVTSGFRTAAQQEYEYSKGRTIPGIEVTAANPMGQPVTWAKAGESKHNSGTAIDVYYATATGIEKDRELAPEIVEIARQEGFDWGGHWIGDKRDPPHFQYRN